MGGTVQTEIARAYDKSFTYLNRFGQGWKIWDNKSIENKPRNALIKATFEMYDK